MANSTRRKRVSKAAVKMTALALMSLGGASNVQAGPQNIEADWQHFLNCADWLINDPPRHADNCSPSRVAPLFGTLAPGQESVPPVPTASVAPSSSGAPPEEDYDPYDDYDSYDE